MPRHAEGSSYDFVCEEGHRNYVVLQQSRFEVLSDVAVNAIVDGYFREAVASFTASLERFYEWYVRVVYMEAEGDSDLINNVWKSVAAQSERQLGMFIATYTSENREQPPLMSNKMVSFRNAVIHKGYLPSEAEAIDYGESISDILVPLFRESARRYKKGNEDLTFQHLRLANERAPKGVTPQTLSHTMPFTLLAFDQERYPDLKSVVSEYRKISMLISRS